MKSCGVDIRFTKNNDNQIPFNHRIVKSKKQDIMKKSPLKEQIKEVATKVCQALNALQYIERQFDDDLIDENGKNVEAEYYALRNAIASVKSAYEDIKDI